MPDKPQQSLEQLLAEKKFQPSDFYIGPDAEEDGPVMTDLVNSAIQDIKAMPEPRASARIRSRLEKMLRDADLFATEDRDEIGRYAVLVWRACGFVEESRLFDVPDDRVLKPF